MEVGEADLAVAGPSAEDISPNKDGGVRKEIRRPGEGSATPSAGDTVTVHYVGTLRDGSQFDSSRDRGQVFEFKLGKGEVIKAWDIGVATMKKGELAMLYCKSEYAYGEKGSPPNIPPNTFLIFEVELLSWKGEDLTQDKDGGIIRQKIEAGEKYTTPNEGAMVTVHLIGRYKDVAFEDRELTFPLGEGCEFGIVSGIEMALEKFKKGEKSLLTLKPEYAFGKDGNKEFNIPPDAEVTYEVTLKMFEKAKESWELDNNEKIEQAKILKDKGTNYVKNSKFQLAINQYKKMLNFIDRMSGMKEEEAEQKQLVLAANLNLALCYLKQNDSKNALDSANKALEQEHQSEKGLFRRGMAYMGINEMNLAKADFQAVLTINPDNKAATNQIILCNKKMQEHRDRERQLYGNMFAKFAQQDQQRSGGDVMCNPGTWGEDDSNFKGSEEQKNERNKMEGDRLPLDKLSQQKIDEINSAISSEEVNMVP